MSDTRSVAHNTISQVVARIVTLLASFAVIPIMARYLGPDLYGVYSLVIVINSFLISMTDLGIVAIATREASKDLSLAEIYTGQAVLLRIISSLILTALAIGIMFLTPYSMVIKISFAIAAAAVIFNSIQSALGVYLQAHLKVYLGSIADMIGRVISTLLMLAAINFAIKLGLPKDQGLYLVFVGMGIGTLLIAILTIMFSLRSRIFRTGFDKAIAKQILTDSIPLWGMSVFFLVNYRIDTVLLSIIKGSYEVGIYNLSYKLLDITLTFPTFFMASVFPLLGRKLEDPKEFRSFAQRAFETMAFGAVPIGLGIFAISPQTISILGGAKFMQAVEPLRFLALAGIFSYMTQFLLYMMVVKNHQKLLLLVTIVVSAVNVVLNLFLIPRYSFNGAAAVTLVSEFLMFLLLFITVSKVHDFHLQLNVILRILAAGLTMFTTIYFIPTNNLLVVIPLAGVVYLVISYLLRAFDFQTVREIISRR
jgi:O-antigen/teichoic acid export membrane protein